MFKSSLLNYELPVSSINQQPYENPLNSKLLIADNRQIILFKQFPDYVESDSLFVFNKSTVRKVRILTEKNTGGSIEIFITTKLGDFEAICLLKSSDRKFKNKTYTTNLFNFEIQDVLDDAFRCIFDMKIDEIINKYGILPLPPYIKDNPKKRKFYNNQFSDSGFSIAAPTAGLHFTNNLIENLKSKNIKTAFINLDINLDTFKPVKSENLSDHNIHKEFYSIDNTEYNKIISYKESNKNIYCVGTTTLRAIETAYNTENLVGNTDLFILPDTNINLPTHLITNFHAPMSSLLSIVQNAYGDNWKELYKYAIDQGLKFLSFGDAVLFKYK